MARGYWQRAPKTAAVLGRALATADLMRMREELAAVELPVATLVGVLNGSGYARCRSSVRRRCQEAAAVTGQRPMR